MRNRVSCAVNDAGESTRMTGRVQKWGVDVMISRQSRHTDAGTCGKRENCLIRVSQMLFLGKVGLMVRSWGWMVERSQARWVIVNMISRSSTGREWMEVLS